jgi:rSAM/selenodomain-associated transferase 1
MRGEQDEHMSGKSLVPGAQRPAPSTRRALVVVGKAPIAGHVKTRLCPPLTAERAAGLHRAFLRDTVALAQAVDSAEVAVLYPPCDGAERTLAEALGPAARLLPQQGEGLGAALSGATAALLGDGADRYDQVALISSDNPDLPPARVAAAFAALDENDVALGPAEDGGYYLIALSRPQLGLFERIAWSTAVVFDQTRERAAALGLRLAVLPPWRDVDDVAGLRRLHADLAADPAGGASHTRAFLRAHYPAGLDA